jgi:hybrid cluster-associated redox disulfide protein
MVARTLRPTLTVAQVIETWPATAVVFLDHEMACVGCAMSPFDTLAEAAGAYGCDLAALLEELSGTAGAPVRGVATAAPLARRRARPRRSPQGGER